MLDYMVMAQKEILPELDDSGEEPKACVMKISSVYYYTRTPP